MKLFTSYLVVMATAIAAFAPVAQASNPSPAVQALQIRGQAMNTLCDNPTLSREGFVAVCGTTGSQQQPTRAELRGLQIRGAGMNSLAAYQPTTPDVRALQIRGQGMNAMCENPTLSREVYVTVCGTKGAANQPTRGELTALQIRGEAMDSVAAVPATVTSGGVDWNDFSIGAVSMLGLVLLAGGIAAGVHYGRKGSVRPRPAS